MSDVYNEIREWLLIRPVWLQEAAERVLKGGELDQLDLQAVCAMLKEPAFEVAQQRAFDGLIKAPIQGGELRLMRIGEVCGIENLSSKRPLIFGDGNLTVIYGHNGSGKSSYTRILKKASGKPRAGELKPNVFSRVPGERKCQITFYRDREDTVQWPANGSPIDAIRAMDIFDSDEATHYLTRESAASYLPPAVGLLESLARACKEIQKILRSELSQLVSALPAMPAIYSATESARRYGALADLTDAEVDEFLTWTTEDASELDTLLKRLKTTDHAGNAKILRKKKVQVDQIISGLMQAVAAFGPDSLATLRDLRVSALEKRAIASEAANVKSAKVDGVGTQTWYALWEAARSYSQIAYPGQAFPVTDARCVLCHQELAGDSSQRLCDFENFVQGKLEADAKAAEEALQQSLGALPTPPVKQNVETQCEAAGLHDGWSEHLWSFWDSVSQVRTELVSGTGKNMVVVDTKEALDKLHSYSEDLEREAAQSEKDALDFDRAKALKEKSELEALRWISEQAASVRTETERCRRVQAYEGWIVACNPKKISDKAAEVAEQVITPAYVTRFKGELEKLGAMRIDVELVKTRTDVGKVLHQLKLKGVERADAMPGSVLSEGERRIISLAAFLADVADKPEAAPFVFDDPISSLDHDFEWSVASRLVELAKYRQVIVFTHRLSLLGAMEDAAKELGDHWEKQHYHPAFIESYSGVAGNPVAQETLSASTTTANNILLGRITAAEKAGEDGGGAAYRGLAQGICIDFRMLLERTVEDDLLNKVVKRHRRSVTVDKRLKGISVVTSADCEFIDGLMAKYNCFAHSQSQEVPVVIPEANALRADIEELQEWRKKFVVRRKARMDEGVLEAN
ncbi:MAG: AAA family ATPase [Pseudohongiella nitratireducens]|nr:AAA family ATPase [Pseudohongiella nitratireducens]